MTCTVNCHTYALYLGRHAPLLRTKSLPSFSKCSVVQQNEKPAFSSFFGLKSVFETLYFRDGLVWIEDQTVEIKLFFQISLRCADAGQCTVLYHGEILVGVINEPLNFHLSFSANMGDNTRQRNIFLDLDRIIFTSSSSVSS